MIRKGVRQFNKKTYCSKRCQSKDSITNIKLKCKQCDIDITVYLYQLKGVNNKFCSQSCSATYNNEHKTHGYRRSKLEIWLESLLPKLYPNLEFHFNRKDSINSELDIYIPNIKLAFELNGIFHYEPIYSKKQLERIQNNDNRKFQACLERNIELCIINTSNQKSVTEKSSQPYLNIITDTIERKENWYSSLGLNQEPNPYKELALTN